VLKEGMKFRNIFGIKGKKRGHRHHIQERKERMTSWSPKLFSRRKEGKGPSGGTEKRPQQFHHLEGKEKKG